MFVWVFALGALLVGAVLGWKPAVARYWVYRLERGNRTAADKLEELGPAAIPALIGAVARGRSLEAEPEASSLLAKLGAAGEKALLGAYRGEGSDMERSARLAWALRCFKTEAARKAYHHAMLDGRLALYRFHHPIRSYPVVAALWALAARQEDDGRWSASRWGTQEASDVEITALACLAFCSHGDTRQSGTYSFEFGRALDFLMREQRADGLLGSGSMREHALAGLALAEACSMEGNGASPLASLARRAADYTIARQESTGGWVNVPGEAPDAFTSALCVMQLKSAKIARLTVDPGAFQGALRFFDALVVGDDGGANRLLVRPRPGEPPTVRSLASGAVVRNFLGFSRDDPALVRLTAEAVRRHKEFMADPWAGYMGKIAAFQSGGEAWEKWYNAEKELLLPAQLSSGVGYGLWPPDSDEARRLGPVGHTALRTLGVLIGRRGEYIPLYTK